MDSSSVAFERLEMWKNSQTVLSLTVYDNGALDHFTGSISHLDWEERLVGFVTAERTILPLLELSNASLSVKGRRVEAFNPDRGEIVFEEMLAA